MSAIYDFKEINQIPIEQVLELHGIYPNAKGWYSIRPEDDTPSASIDPKRRYGNTIHDFGETGAASNTFTPITLTMYLRGLDPNVRANWAEAARILGEAFGVKPLHTDKSGKPINRDYVSDWDWKKIGIYADMASKNMTFDPERYGHDRTRSYAEKYRISMNELRERSKTDSADKSVYERIVRSHGIEYVLELKNSYFSRLYNRSLLNLPDVEDVGAFLAEDAELVNEAKELSDAEAILMKALKGTSIKYKPNARPYNVYEDYHRVVNGDVGFEIGEMTQHDIQVAAFEDKVKVFDCLVTRPDYFRLVSNGLDNIRFSAKQKGDKVKLSFLSTDSGRVNYLVKALRGIERDVAEGHDLSRGLSQEVTEDEIVQTADAPEQEGGAEREDLVIT